MGDLSAQWKFGKGAGVAGNLLKAAQSILFWGIVCQYLIYYLGLAPVASLVICWPAILLTLVGVLEDQNLRVAPLALLWMAAMSAILLFGLMSFYSNGSGGTYLARWPFSLGLAAFLPLVGSLIDQSVLARAASILGIQTLAYSAVAMAAALMGSNFSFHSLIPDMSILPDEYFLVTLWGGEVATGELRPVAFAPYATYAGALACVYALLSLGERRPWLQWAGFSGWLLLAVLSLARTAWIGLACGLMVVLAFSLPKRLISGALGCALLAGAVLMPLLWRIGSDAFAQIEQMRPTSTEVRHNLRTIAYEEWEFGGHPLAGVGQSIPGGTVVANLHIGTHDTLNTNLMIRGVLGLGMIALPLSLTLLYGVVHQRTLIDSIAVALVGLLILYSYSENFEGIIQYCWPALLAAGSFMAHRTPVKEQSPSLKKS